MSLLETTPTPLHRRHYPGELFISLDSHPGDDEKTSYPGGLSVLLRPVDGPEGARSVAVAGICELVVQHDEPVELITGEPVGDGPVELATLADLATFTGTPLAAELLAHMHDLLAQFRPGNDGLERTVQFRDLDVYNALMCELAGRYLGLSRPRVLAGLLAWTEAARGLQLAWYQTHRPTEPGETRFSYRAEAVAFAALADAYRAATERALAA